jgi:hypothetical protein
MQSMLIAGMNTLQQFRDLHGRFAILEHVPEPCKIPEGS